MTDHDQNDKRTGPCPFCKGCPCGAIAALRAEQEALKAEIERLRGLLMKAADKIRACNGWHMTSAEELADLIDQELGQ